MFLSQAYNYRDISSMTQGPTWTPMKQKRDAQQAESAFLSELAVVLSRAPTPSSTNPNTSPLPSPSPHFAALPIPNPRARGRTFYLHKTPSQLIHHSTIIPTPWNNDNNLHITMKAPASYELEKGCIPLLQTRPPHPINPPSTHRTLLGPSPPNTATAPPIDPILTFNPARDTLSIALPLSPSPFLLTGHDIFASPFLPSLQLVQNLTLRSAGFPALIFCPQGVNCVKGTWSLADSLLVAFPGIRYLRLEVREEGMEGVEVEEMEGVVEEFFGRCEGRFGGWVRPGGWEIVRR